MERGGEGKNRCWPGKEGEGVNSDRPAINHLFVQSMGRDTKVSLVKAATSAPPILHKKTRDENRIQIGSDPRQESHVLVVLRGISSDVIDKVISAFLAFLDCYTLFKRVSKGVGVEMEIDSARAE